MMRANGFTRNRATSRAACPLAYGGSANATSYCPGCSCSANLRASRRWMVVRSATLSVFTLARSATRAARCSSTKSAVAAPRDSASRPRAPDPANRSSTRAPRMERCRMLNHASRTRSAVGRILSVAGVLRRRPLNSPAMMRTMPPPSSFRRRQRRHPRLQRGPPLPLVALQPERHIERPGEPGVWDGVRPLEPDRLEHARPVVQEEPQVVRAHAPGVDGAGAAYAEHRRRVAGPARLQVADQLFQLLTHQAQGQLQIDALRGDQVVGAKKLARRAEKRNTKRLVAIAPDGEARGHGVPAVLLE